MSEAQMNMKYGTMQMVCMSNTEWDSPEDMLRAVQLLYEYITEGVDFENPTIEFSGGPQLVQ